MKDLESLMAAFCDHANEVPASLCRCPTTCYCRANKCKTQEKTKGIVPEWSGSEDFGGSDFDTGFESGWDRQTREQLAGKQQSEYLANSYEQPAPVKNNYPFIKDLVAKDLEERAAFGFRKYNMYLQPFNGRDILKDIYNEQMDALIYIRQLIYERDGK